MKNGLRIYYHIDKTRLPGLQKGGIMTEKNDLMVLDENRMAVILLRVLMEKGMISRTTYDRAAKIYAARLKEAA